MIEEKKQVETLCKIRDVFRAIAEFEGRFEQVYDLSLNEGMLLCTLQNRSSLTSGEIADALGVSASNASKVIRSVERKKLVVRQIGREDKRQMFFVLTPEGKERIAAVKSMKPELPVLLQQVVDVLSLK